jgi:hypothetical protein
MSKIFNQTRRFTLSGANTPTGEVARPDRVEDLSVLSCGLNFIDGHRLRTFSCRYKNNAQSMQTFLSITKVMLKECVHFSSLQKLCSKNANIFSHYKSYVPQICTFFNITKVMLHNYTLCLTLQK